MSHLGNPAIKALILKEMVGPEGLELDFLKIIFFNNLTDNLFKKYSKNTQKYSVKNAKGQLTVAPIEIACDAESSLTAVSLETFKQPTMDQHR
ncbi:hypothetical protein IWQ54_003426 [Labrenzia sp. EL_195]|nr:hypothetical protein [Labrenzia sp. EL_195]